MINVSDHIVHNMTQPETLPHCHVRQRKEKATSKSTNTTETIDKHQSSLSNGKRAPNELSRFIVPALLRWLLCHISCKLR